MSAFTLALFGHILAVAYLLGADLGRLYLARVGAGPAAALPTRINAALVALLPAGVSLGAAIGVFRIVSPAWEIATWVVSAAWLALSLAADRAGAAVDCAAQAT